MIKGNLPRISCVRPDKIYTLSKEIVVKKYGQLANRKTQDVIAKIYEIMNNA